jgi:hypothetical protein
MCRKMIYLVSFVLVLSFVDSTQADLVGYWNFNEGSGTIAYDSSDNGLDGTLRGNPQWVTGRVGDALEFDGDDSVEIPHDPLLSITDEITITVWTYMNATASGEMAVVSKGGWAANDLPYELTEEAGRVIYWQFFDDVGRDVCAPPSPPVEEWHHLAGTYDGQIFKCYIDGELAYEWAYAGKMPENTASVFIGQRSRGGLYFKGIIDEVAIYSRALGEDEILDAYEGRMAPTPSSDIYYVDANARGKNDGSSWANAYVYLQDALADANEAPKPVEIRVAQGTYTPDRGVGQIRGDWNSKFLLKSGTTIKGGFAGVGVDDPNAWDYLNNPTILTADLNKDDMPDFTNRLDNSYHVIWCIEGDASAVLDSVMITDGDAVERQGGGIFNYQARPTIKRCHFVNNYASQGGAMTNTYSSPTIINCTFSGNLSDFGGGGMYNDYSHPIVESCVFYDNRTTILGGGGMYCGGSDPNITNCLFINNEAPFGGGMYNAAANPTLINCTFTNNQGGAWGGGMQNDAGANPRVTNCILWGDIPDEISFPDTGTVTYSIVQGGWAGVGNINRDPRFADLEGRLSAGSPCIDAGNNDAVSSDNTTDLDGNPRIIDGVVDMGAYEFSSPPPGPSADPLAEALDTTLSFTTGGDEAWFSQTETYYHDGDAAQSGSITHDQESWLQTTVDGAGIVSFYWKVSSEGNCDYLEFCIDGVRQDRISDSEDWHEMTYEITGSASHTLEWRYFKDGSMSRGKDCGCVDKVVWTPVP